jgi:predicted enzyme related to lactoylglutathione lyase
VAPSMKTILYPVTDPSATKGVFTTLLGTEPMVDSPQYVGYQIGDLHVGLVPNDPDLASALPYWHVDDIEAAQKALLDAGATAGRAVRNVGGGKLVCTVTDADGNVIGLTQTP